MKHLRIALAALIIGALGGAAAAQYSTLNYMQEGGAYWGVGGTLEIKSGGVFKQNGIVLKVARGVDAVTGTLDKTTGLTTVIACAANLAEDPSLAANVVSYVIPTQSGGTAGHVTLKVWKPTASGDATPIAGTAAKNVGWVCIGT
ncbi:MAG TPA: hypothetical protein VKT73_13110 [Xanthobacteraceae bacterium]|nr:hypothetical protein [Xanthobacteraceae bacterium]